MTRFIMPAVFLLLLSGIPGLAPSAFARESIGWDIVVRPPATAPTALDGAVKLLEKELKCRKPEIEVTRRGAVRAGIPSITLGVTSGASGQKNAVPGGFELPDGLAVPESSEGYVVWSGVEAGTTHIYGLGADARGALYAAAHVLRAIDFEAPTITLPEIAPAASKPVVALRGHQLGYGNMNNTIDAWDLDQFDQYIRDLIIFGTNAIELSPSLDPETRESVHMTSTMWDMNIALSKLIHSYGLDVWLWMAVEVDLKDPAAGPALRDKWSRLFVEMPYIDHVFLAGGDPGDNDPYLLMTWLGEAQSTLRAPHPEAGIWVSNQGFEPDENDVFFNYLQEKQPEWFTGAVFGPWAKISIQEMRTRTPARYRVRRYPDITHSLRCQYPVPDWDPAFSIMLGREPFNPRPIAMREIHKSLAPYADGFVAYSEGVNDDVNKMLWSAFGWNPDADPRAVLEAYGDYFMGHRYGKTIAQGLLGLEENWRGALAENTSIAPTAALWRDLAQRSPDTLKKNWRFQLACLRACYDDYVQKRSRIEVERETRAIATLRSEVLRDPIGALAHMKSAMAASGDHPDLAALRAELDGFGPVLFDLIGMQLDVKRFHAMNPERGAILEALDTPLNNRAWWLAELDRIEGNLHSGALDDAGARAQILALCDWDQAPEGGFYDDLGHVGKQPHLVVEHEWAQDPGGVTTAMVEFSKAGEGARLSWSDQAQTLFGTPLKMRYEGLDPGATYALRVVYAGRFRATMTLTADGQYPVHGPVAQPSPAGPLTFAIPREATKDGVLNLAWDLVKGRGCQVAEVWLYPEK